MDLKEFSNKPSAARFDEINNILDKRYGVKINESGSTHRMQVLKGVLTESIKSLKDKGYTPSTSDDLNRYILMKEAVDLELIGRMDEPSDFDEFSTPAITTNQELADQHQDRIIESLSNNMASFAMQLIDMGDSYQYAIDCVMREYKRSPMIYDEKKIRDCIEGKLGDKLRSAVKSIDHLEESKEMKEKIQEKRRKFMKDLRMVLESGVEEAEVIIGTRSFSKSLQEMIEKIGRLQNEDLPPLTDEIRSNYGIEEAGDFHEKTQSTLQSVLDALYFAKEEIDRTVQNMASGRLDFGVDMDDPELQVDDMSADIDVDIETKPEDSLDAALDDLEDSDENEPLGRVQKEGKTFNITTDKRTSELKEAIDALKSKIQKKKAKK